jgi:hypothetical protein
MLKKAHAREYKVVRLESVYEKPFLVGFTVFGRPKRKKGGSFLKLPSIESSL